MEYGVSGLHARGREFVHLAIWSQGSGALKASFYSFEIAVRIVSVRFRC